MTMKTPQHLKTPTQDDTLPLKKPNKTTEVSVTNAQPDESEDES